MSEGMDWSKLAALTTPPSKLSQVPVPGMSAGGGIVSSRNGVDIRSLSRDDIAKVFCGGLIGKGDKMCIVPGCGIAKHKTEKAQLDGESMADIRCYIETTGNNPTSVFLEPAIPSERFGSALVRYLSVTRSPAEWELLFMQLKQGGFAIAQPYTYIPRDKLIRLIN